MDSFNNNRDYDITFAGLKNGQHLFYYTIEDSFFELFEHSPVHRGHLTVEVGLDKKNTFLILTFNIKGTVQTECDNCLKKIDVNVEGKDTIHVRFNEELIHTNEFEADVMYISPNDVKINIAQLVYEFAILNIPIKKVCVDSSECATFRTYGKEESEASTDPRWQALQALKQKNNDNGTS